MHSKELMPELSHHQWKLIFDAVRKQQANQIVSSKFYEEYSEILTEIYSFAFSETYLDNK